MTYSVVPSPFFLEHGSLWQSGDTYGLLLRMMFFKTFLKLMRLIGKTIIIIIQLSEYF